MGGQRLEQNKVKSNTNLVLPLKEHLDLYLLVCSCTYLGYQNYTGSPGKELAAVGAEPTNSSPPHLFCSPCKLRTSGPAGSYGCQRGSHSAHSGSNPLFKKRSRFIMTEGRRERKQSRIIHQHQKEKGGEPSLTD